MKKFLFCSCWGIIFLINFYLSNCYAYYAQEVNDNWETAIFVKSGDIITGQFETDGDKDVFKFIVIQAPGTLSIDFKPQKAAKIGANIRIKIFDSELNLVKTFPQIFNIPKDEEPESKIMKYNFLNKGLYYLQIESTVIASAWDTDSHYVLKISGENGLLLATEECHQLNLTGCVNEIDCEAAGGYWYLDKCHEKPCSKEAFFLCPDKENCATVGGYWSERLNACFQEDVVWNRNRNKL